MMRLANMLANRCEPVLNLPQCLAKSLPSDMNNHPSLTAETCFKNHETCVYIYRDIYIYSSDQCQKKSFVELLAFKKLKLSNKTPENVICM